MNAARRLAAISTTSQPGMSEANAPIPAVQSGAVAWQRRMRNTAVSPDHHFYQWSDWKECDARQVKECQDTGGRIEGFPELRTEVRPLYADPQSEPLPGGVGEADYAAIGRGLVNAIEAAAAEYPWVRSWSPAERYDEIVSDLLDLAFPDTPVQSVVDEIRALETRSRPVDVIADFLKERDDAVGTLDADDDERMESAQRILAALSGKEQG